MSTKVLVVKKDVTAEHEGNDAKLKALTEYIENTHLAFNEQGVSHIALIYKGEGNFRLINAKSLPTLMKFIQDSEASDGPFITVHYMEVHTRQ